MSTDTLSMLHNLLVLLIAAISGPLARHLTALVKAHWNTKGVTTTTVAGVLSALVAGVFGYFANAYGHGNDGIIRAVIATILAALSAAGAQQAAVTAGVKANIASGLAPASTPSAQNGLE